MTGHRPWLLRAPSGAAAGRLFCFPYSGCGASMYRRWPVHVRGVEVCPVQLPARENRIREPHYGTFEALAEAVAAGIEPFLDRPYALFGHCAGGLLAYEVALRLSGGRPPDRLFISSQPAPGEPAAAGFLVMTEADLRAELVRLIEGMGGRPTVDMLDLTMSVYRPDLAAARAYRPRRGRSPRTPVTVLDWTSSGVARAGLAAWTSYAAAAVEELPGGHYDFLSAPAALLRVLTDWLSPAAGPQPSTRRDPQWTP